MSLPKKTLTTSKRYNLQSPFRMFKEHVDWSACGHLLEFKWLRKKEAALLPGMSFDKLTRGAYDGELRTASRQGTILFERQSIIEYLQRRNGLPLSIRQCPTCHGIFASGEDCAVCEK